MLHKFVFKKNISYSVNLLCKISYDDMIILIKY